MEAVVTIGTRNVSNIFINGTVRYTQQENCSSSLNATIFTGSAEALVKLDNNSNLPISASISYNCAKSFSLQGGATGSFPVWDVELSDIYLSVRTKVSIIIYIIFISFSNLA